MDSVHGIVSLGVRGPGGSGIVEDIVRRPVMDYCSFVMGGLSVGFGLGLGLFVETLLGPRRESWYWNPRFIYGACGLSGAASGVALAWLVCGG